MPTVPIYNIQGAQVGEIALNDIVFGSKVNKALLHEAVVMQLASRRLGTSAAKNRSAVRGGGRKPWRQKGTGQARAGSRRSPLWTGGGIIFGPTPRDYGYSLPKKARRQALRSALSAKVEAGELIVVDELNITEPKTKTMVGVLGSLKANKALVVTSEYQEALEKSARNIPGVEALVSTGLNVYDILAHDHLVITKEAIGKVEEALA
ncbi:LSU ribosomal protein L4P [Hydrogenispora ethanolica]|jgi:large subunit ribosomal protein L4|uniref:Large ribosomal subunit protein uL4 n=1 Tax=Hydrogenispora ethanolica TaxID=1082276 RepID=A0A4R1RJW5_HYDET|nr:50S ribosomal protein L4 [Hydrogenispora ethanolica]TCL66461.1 LSU ribosomal protein L4P [Hydrogenispora ethanolica]